MTKVFLVVGLIFSISISYCQVQMYVNGGVVDLSGAMVQLIGDWIDNGANASSSGSMDLYLVQGGISSYGMGGVIMIINKLNNS